jgi:hypothetical protein
MSITAIEADQPVTLSPSRIAQRHGCSEQFVRNLIAEGILPAVRVKGRIFVSVALADELFGVTSGGEPVGLRPGLSLAGVGA